jgi:signal transduction histidine kinase
VGAIDLDLLPDAVVAAAADGTIIACNDRARILLGLSSADVGRPLATALALRDDLGRPCSIPTAVAAGHGRSPEHDLAVVVPGGLARSVAVVVRWHPDGLVLTARPGAHRRARERAAGEMIAMVSHEIRSPLTSVKGFTRTLLQRWDRFSDEQRKVMLATIDHDADRVTQLLRDLLEVSRIDAGRVQLQRSRLDLGRLVAGTVERVGRREDAQGRELRLEVADGLPRVLGDEHRLEQVLTNLLDNALREAPQGPIEVSVRPVAGPDGSPVAVEIDVRDHGPGVAAALAPRVFRKFGRGRGARRSGMGLGLYLSRGLVEAHGGTISLASGPGGGSDGRPDGGPDAGAGAGATADSGARFRVYLPAASAAAGTGGPDAGV